MCVIQEHQEVAVVECALECGPLCLKICCVSMGVWSPFFKNVLCDYVSIFKVTYWIWYWNCPHPSPHTLEHKLGPKWPKCLQGFIFERVLNDLEVPFSRILVGCFLRFCLVLAWLLLQRLTKRSAITARQSPEI